MIAVYRMLRLLAVRLPLIPKLAILVRLGRSREHPLEGRVSPRLCFGFQIGVVRLVHASLYNAAALYKEMVPRPQRPKACAQASSGGTGGTK